MKFLIIRYFFIFFLFFFSSYGLQGQSEKDTLLEMLLDKSIKELMDTKVSIATKSDMKLSETPSMVTVITAEMIKNSGARYLTDILQYIPGFEFSKGRTGVVNIGIRGVKDPLTTSRFLVLKDGAPFNGIMYGMGIGITKLFDINSIERIEVIRGPGSALYGRNAFIGIINIITKSAKKKNEVNLYASAGNFNTYDVGASYGTKKNDFEAYLSVEKIKSDVTGSKFNNGMGGESVWNLAINNLFANTKIQYKNFTVSGMYSDIVNGASTGPFITISDKSMKMGVYSLEYKNKITKKINFNAKLYGRNEFQTQHIEIFHPDMTAELAPGVPVTTVYPGGMYVTPQFNAYTYGSDFNFNFNVLKKHETLIGVQADMYGVKNAGLVSSYDIYTGAPLTYIENGNLMYRGKDSQIKEERGWIEGDGHDYFNIAFYFQNIYYPINNLSFTIGGRFDIDSEFGGVFNPRLALVWNTNKKIIFKLLYGQAYRAPNTQEQYRKTGFTIGNKNLKPETIKTTEFSVDYNIGKNINTRLTLFYNILADMIYAQGITSGVPGGPYDNIGDNTSMGLEYEYRIKLDEKFYMFFNYSYTFSENNVSKIDTIESFMHPDVAPHKVNLGLNYKFLKHFNLNTNIIYRSERQKYFAINKSSGNYILDLADNKTYVSQDQVGNYFLINAKLRIFKFFHSMEISAEVYNILNTKYYDQDTEYAHQPAREGTQYIFTLSYKF
jgi:iron complex outermembrane receptor protein